MDEYLERIAAALEDIAISLEALVKEEGSLDRIAMYTSNLGDIVDLVDAIATDSFRASLKQ